MKKIFSGFSVLVLVFSLIVSLLSFNTSTAEAAVTNWQRGGSIYSRWSDDFASASFKQSLQNLKATGANYVTLVIPLYQDNDQSSNIYASAETPTDATLIAGINYA